MRLSVSEGLARIREASRALGNETIAVDRAFARIVAAPIHARFDVPRFACSAMDGYAVRVDDTLSATRADPVTLRLNPTLAAGAEPRLLAAGSATPISTGAPVPPGADAVLIRERAEIDNKTLLVRAPVDLGANVRSAGEDMSFGEILARDGDVLGAEHVGMLAAAGVTTLDVRRRPRIAYFSTGDELIPAGSVKIGASSIIDVNRPMIRAVAEEAGIPFDDGGHVEDCVAGIGAAIDRAGEADLIVSSGGVSVGTRDFVRESIEAAGGRILFHGLDMRPGKPLLFAELPGGKLYFGLPGNPVAALVAFRFFVLEAARAMLRHSPEQGELVARDIEPSVGPTRFLRVVVTRSGAAIIHIDTVLDQRSHILSSVAAADAWLRVDNANGTETLFPKHCGRLT